MRTIEEIEKEMWAILGRQPKTKKEGNKCGVSENEAYYKLWEELQKLKKVK